MKRDAWCADTRKTYESNLRKWETFCYFRNECAYPPVIESLCSFLIQLSRTLTFSTVYNYACAVRYGCLLRDQPSPLDITAVKLVLKGLRRHSRPPVERQPLTYAKLLRLRVHLLQEGGDLLWCLVVLAFGLLLRKSEFLRLTWADVECHEHYLVVRIFPSKTGVPRNPVYVPVYCSCPSPLCPVHAFSNVMRATTPTSGSNVFPWTYDVVREKLRSSLARVGDDFRTYGTHGLRRGGAQFLRECGYSDSTIQQAGRWRSQTFVQYLRISHRWAQRMADSMRNTLQ